MSKQTLYVVGKDTSLHISPESAWKAWDYNSEGWHIDTWILENGELKFTDTVREHSEEECEEFYTKVVLAARITALKQTIANAKKELQKAEAELDKA